MVEKGQNAYAQMGIRGILGLLITRQSGGILKADVYFMHKAHSFVASFVLGGQMQESRQQKVVETGHPCATSITNAKCVSLRESHSYVR